MSSAPSQNAACWSTQTLLSGGLGSVKHCLSTHIELRAPDRDAPPHHIPCTPDVSLCLHQEWRHRWCCQHLPWPPFSPLSTGGSWYLCAEDACLLASHSWHCPWLLWGLVSGPWWLRPPSVSLCSGKALHVSLHPLPSEFRARVSVGTVACILSFGKARKLRCCWFLHFILI